MKEMMSVNFYVRKIRESSITVGCDGKEIFAIELDGTIIGSAEKALEVCMKMLLVDDYDKTLVRATIGVLRAIEKYKNNAEF